MTLHQAFAAAFSLVVCTATFASSDTEWPLFGGNWDHQRHTLSKQITPDNIRQLDLAWEFDTGVSSSFQATPIVVNGIMFVSLPFNHVVALKADTGKLVWRYTHDRIKDRPMCCAPPTGALL